MGFNRVSLLGRLVKDIDVRYNEGGSIIGQFTMAVDRPKKKGGEKAEADFIHCVAFGKTAENLGNYVSKGQRLFVDGSIRTGSYTNKKTGQTVYTTDVWVNNFELIEKRSNAAGAEGYANGGGSVPAGFASMGQAVQGNIEVDF